MKTIIDLRNEYFNKIEYSNLNFKSKKQIDVFVRNAFMSSCCEVFTLETVGSAFDKDHSTAIHARKCHPGNLKFSPEYRDFYQTALDIINEYNQDLPDEKSDRPSNFIRVEIAALRNELLNTKKEINRLKKIINKLTK
jgi:hypothetical protein